MRKNKKNLQPELAAERNFDSKSWKIEAGMRYLLSFFSATWA